MLGFGNAGQAFAEMLTKKNNEILEIYDTKVEIVAISTRSKGSIINEDGIDLNLAMEDIEKYGVISMISEIYQKWFRLLR